MNIPFIALYPIPTKLTMKFSSVYCLIWIALQFFCESLEKYPNSSCSTPDNLNGIKTIAVPLPITIEVICNEN